MSSTGLFSPLYLSQAVKEWIAEDISSTDVGGAVVGMQPTLATIFVKSNIVIAGFPFVEALCSALDCQVKWSVKEGTFVEGAKGRVAIGTVSGHAARVLQVERTALEILTRASACASYAAQCVSEARKANPQWKGRIAATRKTTPGSFRLVEKYGAIVGGADPHRYNLSSMVMLKDNHVDVTGNITSAVQSARKLCGFSTKIEVECRSVEDAMEACKAGADVVMLDNFGPEAASKGALEVKKAFPHVIVEASGGVNHSTIGKYTLPGIDIVSIGRITHGPPPCDISMKV